jgi:hypothetical protein
VTSRLETGKSLTFFTVYILLINTVGSAVPFLSNPVFVTVFKGLVLTFNEKLMRSGVGEGGGRILPRQQ